MNRIPERINSVRQWFTLQSGLTPYIIGIGLRQWTEGVIKRYPEYPLMSFCGSRAEKAGSIGHFMADEREYSDSFRKLLQNISVLDDIYDDFLTYERRFLAVVDEIERQGETYLVEHYEEFLAAYDDEYATAVVADGTLTYSETFIESMISIYPGSEEEIRTLSSPYEESFAIRYRRELLGSALRALREFADRRESAVERAASKLQDDYHWMHNNYKKVDKIPLSFFQGELSEVMSLGEEQIQGEIDEIVRSVSSHKEACEAVRERDVFTPEDYERLLWIGKIGSWVDRRKQYNLMANYYIGRYLRHICMEYSLPYEDVVFLLPEELPDVLDGRKTLSDYPIAARKEGGICFYDIDGNYLFLVGNEANDVWKKVTEDRLSETDSESITGKTGYGGKVMGKVRIVLDAHEPGDFHDGDILVTGMTRPDFVPLMRRAGAIVTDEGGITCHAAIVARELKKPCIIGTKIATKVLSDGDMVEVDADKGIVIKAL